MIPARAVALTMCVVIGLGVATLAILAQHFAIAVKAQTTTQRTPAFQAQPTQDLPTISQDCGQPTNDTVELAPLPNSMKAIKENKHIKILTIGAGAVGLRDGRHDYLTALTQSLERAVKGLKVEVINRGISGELARDGADRLKNEVALTEPDMVVWQVGTSDALARVPIDEFEKTLRGAVRWLQVRSIDVILVGAKYSRRLAMDAQYQTLRRSVFRVASQENVMRISHYRAMEAMERARGGPSAAIDAYELSEESYFCLAQYVARAVVASVFNAGLDKGPTRQSK